MDASTGPIDAQMLALGGAALPSFGVRPLDFYEVIWGYPVQDIALTFDDCAIGRIAGHTATPRCGRLSPPGTPPACPGPSSVPVSSTS